MTEQLEMPTYEELIELPNGVLGKRIQLIMQLLEENTEAGISIDEDSKSIQRIIMNT